MQWSDIDFNPSQRTLRQFGGLSLFVFGAMAGYQGIVRHHPIAAAVCGTLALAIGVPGLIKPSLIRHVFVGATILTFPIGWIVSKIILGCMFYGLFTPIALLFRMIGRDSLSLRPHPAAATYWVPKARTTDPSRYFHPF